MLLSQLKQGLLVANVHLIANTDGDWSKDNRFYNDHKQQLDRLNTHMQSPAYARQPTVLSGDFNLAKTCDLYEYFMQKGEWKDATPSDYAPTFHAEFLPAGRTPQRIDFIFTRNGLKLMHTARVFEDKIDGRYVSNHMGLLAELSM